MFRSSSEGPASRCRRACTAGFEHVSPLRLHYRDDELERTLRVCPHCGHHFPLRARQRMEQLVDGGTVRRIRGRARSADPLARSSTCAPTPSGWRRPRCRPGSDAMVVGSGKIERRDCQLAVMDFSFMGGSMGSVVGESSSVLPDCSRAQYTACVRHGLRERGAGNSLTVAEDGLRGRGAARRALRPSRRDDPPDDGWGSRELRQSRRRHRGRAGRAPVVHGTAGRAADRPGKASRRLRARRVELPAVLSADRRRRELDLLLGQLLALSLWTVRPGQGRPSAIEQLRLHERLAKLGEFPLLRGTRMQESSRASAARSIGSRLSRRRTRSGGRFQLARHKERPTSTTQSESWRRATSSFTATARTSTTALLSRSSVALADARSCLLDIKRPRHSRAGAQELRHGSSGGLPQGDPRNGARPPRVPGADLIDTPRAYPGVAAEQHGQGAGSRAPRP